MYASNKLTPGPQTEAGRVGDVVRADNSTDDVIPKEEYRMDGTVDVGVDVAQAGDVEDSKTTTTPMDRGEDVELMRV